MRKNVLIAITMILLCLTSCGEKGDDKQQSIDSKVLDLIEYVPSDALCLIYSDECGKIISKMDSTHVLRKLDFGSLASAKAAMSFCYQGSIVPVLVIDTGRRATDSTEAVSSLMLQARQARLHTHFERNEEEGRSSLVISGSESLMNAVKRHLSEGSSILEAEGFSKALSACADRDDFAIVKNSGATRLMPAGFLGGMFPKSDLSRFSDRLSRWTCILPGKNGHAQLLTSNEDADVYFSQLVSKLPGGRSRAEQIVPDTCEFALSASIDSELFRECYERYLDANVQLTAYTRTLKALKDKTGKDPRKWEKEIEVDEIVVLHWQGNTLQLVHSAGKQDNQPCSDNRYRGFIPALYGSAFKIADDSRHAIFDNWHIFGSEEGINALIAYCASRDTKHRKPAVKRHFMVRHEDLTLEWNEKEISLWNSNL